MPVRVSAFQVLLCISKHRKFQGHHAHAAHRAFLERDIHQSSHVEFLQNTDTRGCRIASPFSTTHPFLGEWSTPQDRRAFSLILVTVFNRALSFWGLLHPDPLLNQDQISLAFLSGYHFPAESASLPRAWTHPAASHPWSPYPFPVNLSLHTDPVPECNLGIRCLNALPLCFQLLFNVSGFQQIKYEKSGKEHYVHFQRDNLCSKMCI